jgi:hypothetical protein
MDMERSTNYYRYLFLQSFPQFLDGQKNSGMRRIDVEADANRLIEDGPK